MYLRQAKFFSGHGDHTNTLLYLSLALDANMEENNLLIGRNVMSTQAISLAKLGDFDLSQRSAEAVLRLDPVCVEAIWIKAESLYCDCDFEHAMAIFSRGLKIAPGFEGFITGIAKVGSDDTIASQCKVNLASAGKLSGRLWMKRTCLISRAPRCCCGSCGWT